MILSVGHQGYSVDDFIDNEVSEMIYPPGVDISVLSNGNRLADDIERSMVIHIIKEALSDAGFIEVELIRHSNDLYIPYEVVPTLFDLAVRYMPEMLNTPITIFNKPETKTYIDVRNTDDDLVIERMHKSADQQARWHLRSHGKNFPL